MKMFVLIVVSIHDYEYTHHVSFKDYDINMTIYYFIKNLFIKEKNIYIINVFILEKLMKI